MESLGINPVLLLTQALNFLIMVGVLSYLVYKPVLKNLEERKKKIEEDLKLQKEVSEEKEKLSKVKERIIVEAEEEGRGIVRRAVERAKKQAQSKLVEEKQKIEEERKKALETVSLEREKTINQAKKQALDYALLISQKILSQKLGRKEQEELVKKAIEDLARLSLRQEVRR